MSGDRHISRGSTDAELAARGRQEMWIEWEKGGTWYGATCSKGRVSDEVVLIAIAHLTGTPERYCWLNNRVRLRFKETER